MNKTNIISLLIISIIGSACQNDISLKESKQQTKRNENSTIRTPEEAIEVAQQAISLLEGENIRSWMPTMRQVDLSAGIEIVRPHATRSTDAHPVMYAVNFKDSNGFALVSPDKHEAPLLAFTENGHFNSDNTTGVAQLDRLIEKYTYSKKTPRKPGFIEIPELADEYAKKPYGGVVPKRDISWGQDSPMGNFAKNKIAGCITTAIIMAMYHFQFPNKATLGYGLKQDENWTFNWDQMKPEGMSPKDSMSLRYLAREIRGVGMAQYKKKSTGIAAPYIRTILRHFDLPYSTPTSFPAETYKSKLNAGNIYLVLGTELNGNERHAWLFNGYMYKADLDYDKKNNIIYTKRVNYYLHFNWGWDGICNGYFSPDFVGINNSQYADKKHQKNLSFNIKDDFADFYLLKNHAAQ